MMKPTPLATRSVLAGILAPLLFPSVALSQAERDAELEPWYRVELLIFTRDTPEAIGAEAWDPLPELAYPAAQRFLVDPGQVAQLTAEHSADGMVEVDEYGRLHLLMQLPPELQDMLPDSPIQSDAPIDDQTSQPAPLQDDTPVDETALSASMPDSPADSEILADEALPPPRALPDPFILLAGKDLEFADGAASVRRGRSSVLLHQAWLQPMEGRRDSLPIVIDRSGDLGDWPRLQGSIKLYVSRYLHLEANLWLNTDGRYFPRSWQMPPPPLGPVSVVRQYPEGYAALQAAAASERQQEAAAASPVVSGDEWLRARATGQVPDVPANAQTEADPAEPVYEATPQQELVPFYPWRHAVRVQQKRRMRSNETHYIDHPLLGIMVKVTRLEEEELQQRSAPVPGAGEPGETLPAQASWKKRVSSERTAADS